MIMELYEYWNDAYINAARVAYPQLCANHHLSVGFKITRKDGTTKGGYYWPLVNGDHDIPVAHVAHAWNQWNAGECPKADGDGLCLVPQGVAIAAASSGGIGLMEGIGHVLIYPTTLSKGSISKRRAPWVIDVDCFDLGQFIRNGLCSADLSKANLCSANLNYANLSKANLRLADLRYANLSYANLSYANLCNAVLRYADLSYANLSYANLRNADLRYADLSKAVLCYADVGEATIWPAGFDWETAVKP